MQQIENRKSGLRGRGGRPEGFWRWHQRDVRCLPIKRPAEEADSLRGDRGGATMHAPPQNAYKEGLASPRSARFPSSPAPSNSDERRGQFHGLGVAGFGVGGF